MHQLVDGAVLIVQKPDEDQSPRALTGAGRRDALLQPREAHDALLADTTSVVEEDLLVRAGFRAELVASTFILIPQDNAIPRTLVHRAARAGLHAYRVGALVAEAGQVEEVAVGPLATALVFIPVRPPARRLADRFQMDRGSLAAVVHVLIVEVPAAAELLSSRECAWPGQAVAVTAAHLFPVLGIAAAGHGIDAAPPHVVGAVLPVVVPSPEHLAGNGTRLASNALVQVEDHGNLAASLHRTAVGWHIYPLSAIAQGMPHDYYDRPAATSADWPVVFCQRSHGILAIRTKGGRVWSVAPG